MATNDRRDDELETTQRDTDARLDRVPGKGYDSGDGYGGAGNEGEYHASREPAPEPNDEQGSAFDASEGGFDADTPLGGTRRDERR